MTTTAALPPAAASQLPLLGVLAEYRTAVLALPTGSRDRKAANQDVANAFGIQCFAEVEEVLELRCA